MAVTKEKGQGKAAFLKKAGKFKAGFKEARKVDPNSGFSNPEMEDGVYVCRLSGVNMGLDKKEVPYVSFQFIVADGEYKGEKPSIFHSLKDDDRLSWLVKDCKRLLPDITEEEWNDIELPDLVDKLEDVGNPHVKLEVKNKKYTPKLGPNKGKEQDVMNVYINKFIGDYDPEEGDQDETPEDDEDSTEETSEDESDDSDTEETEDETPADPEKGNVVLFKAPKSKKKTEYTVIKVNTKARQADIRNDEGVKHTGISFDELELVFDDED